MSTSTIKDPNSFRSKIEDSLNKIRPALHADGGEVEFVDLTEEGVLTLKLLGACGGCAMSMMTMRHGIERVIKHDIPEITAVQAIGNE